MIDAAVSGTTVNVPARTYAGNIVMKAGVTLKGAWQRKTVLDENYSGSVVKIASNNTPQ